MIQFTIPGKLPGLNDYIAAERTNRYLGAKMKKDAEKLIMHSLHSLRKIRITKPVYIAYRWYEPDRRRDKDNISSFGRKVIQDALVKAHVLINDGWAQIADFEDQFFISKNNPRIEVQIIEVENDTGIQQQLPMQNM